MFARLTCCVFAGLVLSAALVASTVTLTLESTKNGQTVGPNTPIDWTIKASVSTGDNAGLALVSVGLSQDATNPALFDIPPATATVPTGMANFVRPAGISNPAVSAGDYGYRGDQRGTAGQKNLVQIGGGQNTFGQAGSSIGTSVTVAAGVGQSAPQIIASGTFNAPATTGVYTFRLDSGLANTLNAVTPPVPPAFWPVSAATVAGVPTATISFTVATGPAICRADCNCDGQISYADINPFVQALGNLSTWQATYPTCPWQNCDINADGVISYADINPFVVKLGTPGACP
jgi:hypothetical protein